MESNSQPLAVMFGRKVDNRTLIFVGRQGDIKIEMEEFQEELMYLLGFCNGCRQLVEIRDLCKKITDEEFEALIDLAEEFGLVIDSRNLYLVFHKDSSNPLKFSQKMSPKAASDLVENRISIPPLYERTALPDILENELLRLSSARRSTRSFSAEPLSLEWISGLLRCMYRVGDQRSTPSAGQLYPLDIYVAVLISSECLEAGLYRYDPERILLHKTKDTIVTKEIIAHVLNSNMAQSAAMVVFIASDLERSVKKYANRGYRFALLEAGHVAQSAYLYCAQSNDIGMIEYGGFQDELTAKFLSLQYPKKAVLIALIVGHIGETSNQERSSMIDSWTLYEELVGKGKPIEHIVINTPIYGTYALPRVQILAKYRQMHGIILSEKDCYGSGLAPTSDDAQIKAIAEAYERYVSGDYRIDVVGPANKQTMQWLDPNMVVPMQALGFDRHDWQRFDPAKEWQWVKGVRLSMREEILIPVDLVFYPLLSSHVNRKLCYAANSSGVAAHFDPQTAIEKALLELIERDAIAVAWYAKRSLNAISKDDLPQDVRFRLRHWLKKGWLVKFLDLTLDSVPVILAIIYSQEKYPSFVAGAAAHFDWKTALTKAWDEAEVFLMNWVKKRPKQQSVEKVFGPVDHGILYFNSENLERIKWIIDAKEVSFIPKTKLSLNELIAKFDPIVIDLAQQNEKKSLAVVRVICEKLIPLNFGYGNEHHGHKRFEDLGLCWNQPFPSFPHFFA